MDINIDGKIFSIDTLGDFKRAGEEIKRVNQFKIDLVKNKYERLKDRSTAAQDANRELQEVHKWYQDTLDKLWKAKAELGNSKDMNHYEKIIQDKKENSIVKRGSFNRGTYTIDKTTGMFGRTVYIVHAHYEKGPSKDMTFGSDSFETLQDAQKYADRLNSKEEKNYYAKLSEEKEAKKNSSSSLSRAINLILSYLQDGWSEDKIKRELKTQHNVTDEDIRDGFIAAKRLNRHI